MPDSRVARSNALYARALELIPGGTQLVSRRPTRFANGVSPVYAVRGKGARIWDLDGNEYIDWATGILAIILGYCDPVVDEAVVEQIHRGVNFSINNDVEVELAEELIKTIPCAEMVRYTKGGGDACTVAVRIARGATGRDKILFCGYHGWHDWYLAANLGADAALNAHLFPGIEPIGVPKALAGTSIPFPYDDIPALEALLEEHRGEVAAVMMEPFRSELPPAGYLDEVARLAKQAGAVLIFDEVSTGLRFGMGGAQQFAGVVPDMAVYAKSMSNGYAFGAVVGKRAVMEQAGRMFISSTYWSDAIGLRAALTTIRELRRRKVAEQIADFGRRLQSAVNSVAIETGCPVRCAGLIQYPQLQFQCDDSALKSQIVTLYIQEMARRGCHGYASFGLNAAQGEAEFEQTLTAVREVFQLITRALEKKILHEVLQATPQQEVFRRLVN
ncbi:MAG: aminotransferase class III-fold pyridoxal phosphate-dependent enzyme [Planctomycetota bacterium]|nr:aminotransferase class III-fold pyridoxal phosphate-dependent enzyme [Planctomycetota bacterium]